MKSLPLGIVRASASSALAYSRLCSGKPDPAADRLTVGEVRVWYNSTDGFHISRLLPCRRDTPTL
ncbi:MAG: hypothetical protein LBQ31_00595 [Bacteroidales bacterium]|nr:hypothetical protein [Bacteroidales bacterium]